MSLAPRFTPEPSATTLSQLPDSIQVGIASFAASADLRSMTCAAPWLTHLEGTAALWLQLLQRGWKLRGGRDEATLPPAAFACLPALYPLASPSLAAPAQRLAAARAAFASLPPYWPSMVDENMLSTSPRHRVRTSEDCLEAQYIGNDLGGDRCVVTDACFPPLLSAPWTVPRYHQEDREARIAEGKPGSYLYLRDRERRTDRPAIAQASFCTYFEIDILDRPYRVCDGDAAAASPSTEQHPTVSMFPREQCVAIGLARQDFR